MHDTVVLAHALLARYTEQASAVCSSKGAPTLENLTLCLISRYPAATWPAFILRATLQCLYVPLLVSVLRWSSPIARARALSALATFYPRPYLRAVRLAVQSSRAVDYGPY